MKFLLILLLFSGCATTQDVLPPSMITKIERVIVPIPSELLIIPKKVPKLSIEELKNNDRVVANWLLDNELRTIQLEQQIEQIRQLYLKSLKASEDQK